MNVKRDRVGIGWRPDLAAGIMDHQDELDVVELIAEDYFQAPRRNIRALAALSRQLPVVLHGVAMGLATTARVDRKYFDRMAQLYDQVKPEAWSEHLAFVRVRDQEIGHLAAPPRTQANVDGAAENLYRASQIVGSKPHVENIATLLDPPGSTFSESEWAREILSASGCELLFDLHNVYANGTNHGWRPTEYLANIGAERIRYLHIAGGRFIAAPDGRNRILDDHLHSVPDPVYALLEDVAAVAPHPLTVILERDGDYPSIEQLLLQTRKAKTAMARGRVRRGITMETAA